MNCSDMKEYKRKNSIHGMRASTSLRTKGAMGKQNILNENSSAGIKFWWLPLAFLSSTLTWATWHGKFHAAVSGHFYPLKKTCTFVENCRSYFKNTNWKNKCTSVLLFRRHIRDSCIKIQTIPDLQTTRPTTNSQTERALTLML